MHNSTKIAAVLGALVLLQLGMLIGQHLPGGAVRADPIGLSVTGYQNPIVTRTGLLTSTAFETIYQVPQDRIFVITDIHASSVESPASRFFLYDATNQRYLWAGHSNKNDQDGAAFDAYSSFSTGIAVEPGTILQVTIDENKSVYTVSGYLALP